MAEPLPFIVKLRTVASDDAAPVRTEVKCFAYSPLDACTQAMVQTFGLAGNADKCTIESIEPDVEKWKQINGKK